jgi:transcriptional regulator of acetoin/glycerol metabolism
MIPETDLNKLKSLSRAARGGTLDALRLAERSYEMGSSACHIALSRSLALPETLNLSELEKAALKKALEVTGNPMTAAKLLGIGKTTVYRKARRYGFLTGTGPAFCPNCGRRMPRPSPQLASVA